MGRSQIRISPTNGWRRPWWDQSTRLAAPISLPGDADPVSVRFFCGDCLWQSKTTGIKGSRRQLGNDYRSCHHHRHRRHRRPMTMCADKSRPLYSARYYYTVGITAAAERPDSWRSLVDGQLVEEHKASLICSSSDQFLLSSSLPSARSNDGRRRRCRNEVE